MNGPLEQYFLDPKTVPIKGPPIQLLKIIEEAQFKFNHI